MTDRMTQTVHLEQRCNEVFARCLADPIYRSHALAPFPDRIGPLWLPAETPFMGHFDPLPPVTWGPLMERVAARVVGPGWRYRICRDDPRQWPRVAIDPR